MVKEHAIELLNTYVLFRRNKFDKKSQTFEAQFSDLGPREGVDTLVVLEHQYS